MDNRSELIDCSTIINYIPKIRELLKYMYKVYIKAENSMLRVFGDEDSLNLCQKLADYFKMSDSQYLLSVNVYTQEALNIKDLTLLFESKCKVFLTLDDYCLCIYGELSHVTLMYSYFLKYDRLVGKENTQFIFTDDDETRLEVLCSQFDIKLSYDVNLKTRVFVYNILLNIDGLLTQIELNTLNSKFDSIFIESNTKLSDKATASGDINCINTISATGKISTANEFCTNTFNAIKDNISKYRTIIIDGNNLAFGHGGDKFSYMGIKLAVDYFVSRGHTKIYALLPRHRQPFGGPIFEQLEREDRLKYTPSRRLNNVRETPYDDRFILDAALFTEGVVLSNDQYRDLMAEKKYKEIICNRLIPYTFIEDHLIIPDDPRGFNGPSLGIILSNPSKVALKSPKKAQKKSKASTNKPTNLISKTYQAPPPQQSKATELRGHQIDLFNRVRDIMPTQCALIKQIILGNPTLSDPNTIMNYVLMAVTTSQ